MTPLELYTFLLLPFIRSRGKRQLLLRQREAFHELQQLSAAEKTLRVHKESVADTLQKYGIFIMHEMPAGAQLIRGLEWEQVGMWQKRGRLQNGITLAKQVYKTDGKTNSQIVNILLMQYRHLSVKQSNFSSAIFLFPR